MGTESRTWIVTQDCIITYSLVSYIATTVDWAVATIYQNGSVIKEAPLPCLDVALRNDVGHFYAKSGDIIRISCNISSCDGTKCGASSTFNALALN